MWSHRPPRPSRTMALALLLLVTGSRPTWAQLRVPSVELPKIAEPQSYRVYQRDRNGTGEIPIALADPAGKAKIVSATVENLPGGTVRFEDGRLRNVPTGGPYTINIILPHTPDDDVQHGVQIYNVFVGDLWVLAGQSNMEGVGDLVDVTPPHPRVSLLGMDGKWVNAAEPLHWLVDSPDPVHSGDAESRPKRATEARSKRMKGAGLGLPFASAMVNATNVPVGLIAAAHGGTSMAQWDPAKKGEGGNSLYGSMLRQVGLAGDKVKGVLWYQGESDAMGPYREYSKAFTDFIAAVRSDLHNPDLPFYYVQIGRFIRGGDPKAWNLVQDVQRTLVDKVSNTAVVSVIDLELDDLIHVGTQGLKRTGQRLSKVALRELFGQAGATTPTFDRVNRGGGNTLVVKFKGVNIAPQAVSGGGFSGSSARGSGAPSPFAMGDVLRAQAGGNPGPAFVGLRPTRHIAGFSVRKEDGSEIPLIFDASVGDARDTVVLKLVGPVPEKAFLWYGYGLDPYCNLTDGQDMGVPVFGPISLDELSK